ncbi:MAG TPA: hypothetical protein VG165_04555 [Solirubrobacteraceae bacterium]|nr:hypothetical protein [Solirubrobacteraceae bacterium]
MTDAFDRLEAELRRAVTRLDPAAPDTGRQSSAMRRRRAPRAPRTWRPVTVGLLLSLLVLTSAAWGLARLISSGSPVAYRFGRPVAGDGLGVPLPATVELLPLRVQDPAGGPPWGIRVFHTSRGFGCLQVGRIVSGELGVLGTDGAFADDGRFHELRPGVVLDRDDCVPLDGSGHPHIAIHDGMFPAGGLLAGCQPPGTLGLRPGHTCPAADLRSLDFGFAGPDATTIEYATGAATATVQASPPDGAYLIVGRPGEPVAPVRPPAARVAPVRPPAARPVPGAVRRPVGPPLGGLVPYTATQTPVGPVVVRVDYRDGTSCLVRASTKPAGGCPAHGPVAVSQPLPSPAAVTTPLHVTLTGRDKTAVLHLSFRARVGVQSERTGYSFLIALPDWRHGPPRPGRLRCATQLGLDLDRDVRAGQTVHFAAPLSGEYCTGTYRIQLLYRVQPPHPSPGGAINLSYPGRLVGAASLTIP